MASIISQSWFKFGSWFVGPGQMKKDGKEGKEGKEERMKVGPVGSPVRSWSESEDAKKLAIKYEEERSRRSSIFRGR